MIILHASLIAQPATSETFDPRPIERLAFGSCVDQNLPQPIWKSIAELKPQVFLALGDNIYADTLDPAKMRADYDRQGAIPEFQSFRAQVPILATWDDHDYGTNDGGADYEMKEASKELFLEFFAEPADSPRRRRPGMYLSKTYGPKGQRVQILLLDLRSFRSPLKLDPSPRRRYRPDLDPDKTLLGEAQWHWLAEQLRQPAEIRLIASGIQVLGYASGFECWKNLPLELERLFQTIRDSEADGVLLLSGDAHFAYLKRSDGGVGYPIYEFTASGLTHSRREAADRPAPLAIRRPYGGLNFGFIEIDWQQDPQITLSARDVGGHTVFQHRLSLSELESWPEAMD